MSIDVFPVVHVFDPEQAVKQSEVVFDAGADGVYLIEHHTRHTKLLLDAYNAVRTERPDGFIGVNFLQIAVGKGAFMKTREAFDAGLINQFPDGIWVDDPKHVKEDLEALRSADPQLKSITYLGGAAFKYTKGYRADPQLAADEASFIGPFVDLVVTSGEQTGTPPTPEKISAMKEAIVPQRLAVASGISAENLSDYEPGSIDQLLVATSLETHPGSGIFVPERVLELIELAHSL
jgi:hypothetical protein